MAEQGTPAWPGPAAEAGAAMYRGNAFRVAGLPVDATPRQVRRRTERLRAAEALGTDEATGPALLPLRPAPSHADVREALRRLDSPATRLSDEFLWFWPLPGSDDLPAPDRARELWQRAAGDGANPAARGVAAHNLAVLAHASVLESLVEGALPDERAWREAYGLWRRVLDDDGVWRRVDERVRELGDARLRDWSGAKLREALPRLLMDVHARVTVRAAATHDETAARHIPLMREFDDGVADGALRRAAAPVAARIRARCERSAPTGDPDTDGRTARELLAEAEPDLKVLRTVLGVRHPVTQDTSNAVAALVHICLVRCVNESQGIDAGSRLELLERTAVTLDEAVRLTASQGDRARFERDLAVVLHDIVRLHCEAAMERTQKGPARGGEFADRLQQDCRPRLQQLARIQDDGQVMSEDAANAVAACVHACLVQWVNAYQGAAHRQRLDVLRQAASGLEDAVRTTTSPGDRAGFERDLVVVLHDTLQLSCVTTKEDAQRDPARGADLATRLADECDEHLRRLRLLVGADGRVPGAELWLSFDAMSEEVANAMVVALQFHQHASGNTQQTVAGLRRAATYARAEPTRWTIQQLLAGAGSGTGQVSRLMLDGRPVSLVTPGPCVLCGTPTSLTAPRLVDIVQPGRPATKRWASLPCCASCNYDPEPPRTEDSEDGCCGPMAAVFFVLVILFFLTAACGGLNR